VDLHQAFAIVNAEELFDKILRGCVVVAQFLGALVKACILRLGDWPKREILRVDPNLVEAAGFVALSDRANDQRHSLQFAQVLSGKALGAHAGGNHGNRFAHRLSALVRV